MTPIIQSPTSSLLTYHHFQCVLPLLPQQLLLLLLTLTSLGTFFSPAKATTTATSPVSSSQHLAAIAATEDDQRITYLDQEYRYTARRPLLPHSTKVLLAESLRIRPPCAFIA